MALERNFQHSIHDGKTQLLAFWLIDSDRRRAFGDLVQHSRGSRLRSGLSSFHGQLLGQRKSLGCGSERPQSGLPPNELLPNPGLQSPAEDVRLPGSDQLRSYER